MDVAASEFHREGKYDLDFKSPPDPQRHITAEELADIYQGFVNNYPGAALALCLLVKCLNLARAVLNVKCGSLWGSGALGSKLFYL